MIPPPPRGQRRRKVVRRAVVMTPNGLTLLNLFCGVYAIILAIRGEFSNFAGNETGKSNTCPTRSDS